MSSPDRSERRDALRHWHRLLRAHGHFFRDHPRSLFQQAANEPDDTPVATLARGRLSIGARTPHWLQWINKPGYLDPCIATMPGRWEDARTCAYSPDGRRVAASGRNGTLFVRDAETGAEIMRRDFDRTAVTVCAYSPDGRRIALATEQRTIKICDAETLADVVTLVGHAGTVYDCAYSPDGHFLVSASKDRLLKIWRTDTWRRVTNLKGHQSAVYDCRYSPDGLRIVSSSDEAVIIWDWKRRTKHAVYPPARHCAYAPGGDRIVAVSKEGLALWDACAHRSVGLFTADRPRSCAVSPDGTRVVAASDEGLRVWDATSGAQVAVLGEHRGQTVCAYSPDGTQILSADGSTMRIWDAQGAEHTPTSFINLLTQASGQAPIAFTQETLTACSLSPDGRRVAAGFSNGRLAIVDAGTAKDAASSTAHAHAIHACAFSPDGHRIASASKDSHSPGELALWDSGTLAEIAKLAQPREASGLWAFSPDAGRMAFAANGGLALADTETGTSLALLPCPGRMTACAFSPDGRLVLAIAQSFIKSPGFLRVWDGQSGTEIVTLGQDRRLKRCALSPDGRRIALSTYGAHLELWDAETGRLIATLGGHKWDVNDCAFSPDGRQCVSGGTDGTLIVWNAEDGARLATLTGRGVVKSCAYTPDGLIVSGCGDGTLSVWDAQTCTELACIEAGKLRDTAGFELPLMAPSRAGSLLVTRDTSGRLCLLRLAAHEPAIAAATLVHLYQYATGAWQERPSARCESCGRRFVPAADLVAVVHTRPTGRCPHCEKPLRFNPFVVDARLHAQRLQEAGSLRAEDALAEAARTEHLHTQMTAAIEEVRRLVTELELDAARAVVEALPDGSDAAVQLKAKLRKELDDLDRQVAAARHENEQIRSRLRAMGMALDQLDSLAREHGVDVNNPMHVRAFLEAALQQMPPAVRTIVHPSPAPEPAATKWWQFWKQ